MDVNRVIITSIPLGNTTASYLGECYLAFVKCIQLPTGTCCKTDWHTVLSATAFLFPSAMFLLVSETGIGNLRLKCKSNFFS